MKLYRITISLIICILLVSCEKSDEKIFDHSLIPAADYNGSVDMMEFHGTLEPNFYDPVPCDLTYHGTVPIPGDEYDRYNAEITRLNNKKYRIKINLVDAPFPTEIEIQLNGEYESNSYGNYAYFNILETDTYLESECNNKWNEFTGNYFCIDDYSDPKLYDKVSFKFEIMSKTGDSLIWHYFGLRYVK
ncbi:hypothetical protein OU798_10165 [Prolixibacteraceae bacterium Z1-6]|uniref:Uncharacterized protein n=1 Tax=Draconibacterium aestuarii TaxID=2998507 RepID=A0A9X3F522_9BACT|nr:hypothetical protein [Prolixibacteraceae bacterium Z1-6]